jgi:hypothetical protein
MVRILAEKIHDNRFLRSYSAVAAHLGGTFRATASA